MYPRLASRVILAGILVCDFKYRYETYSKLAAGDESPGSSLFDKLREVKSIYTHIVKSFPPGSTHTEGYKRGGYFICKDSASYVDVDVYGDGTVTYKTDITTVRTYEIVIAAMKALGLKMDPTPRTYPRSHHELLELWKSQ